MKTLNISISVKAFKDFGLNTTELPFSEFVDILNRELAKRRLEESVKLADKHGLSAMSMDEISAEVKAESEDEENRH